MLRTQILYPAAGLEFVPVIARYAKRWPENPVFADAMADCTKALAEFPGQDRSMRLEEAQRWSEIAIRLYPAHLPFRRRLVAIASARGDHVTVERTQAELARLRPLVHPLNR